METFITVIHVAVAVFMILVVLIQGGNQGGMSAAFGGGNSQGFFGASGATTVLGKLTYGAAAIFMVTSIWLTVLKGNAGNIGLSEKLKAAASQGVEPAPIDQSGKETTVAPVAQPESGKSEATNSVPANGVVPTQNSVESGTTNSNQSETTPK